MFNPVYFRLSSLSFTPNSQVYDWPHFGVLSRRANTSLMPTLEIDKAAIDPAIAEVRDDATPTDFLMLGD